jgi:hypothetical protein
LLISSVCTTSSPRSLQEICSTTGPTHDDLTQSDAYWELFGQGRQEGVQEEAAICGPPPTQPPLRPPEQLEALAVGAAFSAGVALLDFQGPADLAAWLAANT